MDALKISETEVKAGMAEYQMVADTVNAMVVDSDDSIKSAIDFGSRINKFVKGLEDKRKEIVKPLNDEVKKVNDAFKPVVAGFDTLNNKLKAKILEYQKVVEARRQAWLEEQRKKELAEMEERKNALMQTATEDGNELALEMASIVEDKQIEVASQELKAKTVVRSDEAKTTIKRTWKHKVVNENKVDRAFLSVDDKKIKDFIRDHKDEIADGLMVDGIQFYQDESLSY